jgi:hypothetical protein
MSDPDWELIRQLVDDRDRLKRRVAELEAENEGLHGTKSPVMLVRRPAGAKGDGVFTPRPICTGKEVLEFSGSSILWTDFDDEVHDFERFIQVDADVFLGESGGIDDFVNHSCNPNCAMLIDPPRLVSLRDIEEGEEVTFDYSVTSTESPSDWSMKCHCGSKNCRGKISGFATLPPDIQSEYLRLGIVPGYVLKKYIAELSLSCDSKGNG